MPKIEKILKKQEDGTKKTIYPATICQAIRDGKTGASLEALLSQFNSIYVQYNGTAFDTRNLIPESMRRAGLVITYMNMDSETITERAVSAVQADNDHWGLNVNWTRIDQFTLSGRITISSEGTWLVDGEDTGIKAVGPKGDAGLTPWLKTIDNKLHFSYDNVTWEPCSENIAAWFRWSGNKIQISRDNKTWTDLSGKFADNIHIKGYVANYASLPTSAVQGDIYGVGPTYAAEDTAHTNPIYRYYVRNANTWVDNGSFTSLSAGVVQETGDSETEVMSQKAVSEKLSELGQEVGVFNLVGRGESQISIPLDVCVKNRLYSISLENYDISEIPDSSSFIVTYDGSDLFKENIGIIRPVYYFKAPSGTGYLSIRVNEGIEFNVKIKEIPLSNIFNISDWESRDSNVLSILESNNKAVFIKEKDSSVRFGVRLPIIINANCVLRAEVDNTSNNKQLWIVIGNSIDGTSTYVTSVSPHVKSIITIPYLSSKDSLYIRCSSGDLNYKGQIVISNAKILINETEEAIGNIINQKLDNIVDNENKEYERIYTSITKGKINRYYGGIEDHSDYNVEHFEISAGNHYVVNCLATGGETGVCSLICYDESSNIVRKSLAVSGINSFTITGVTGTAQICYRNTISPYVGVLKQVTKENHSITYLKKFELTSDLYNSNLYWGVGTISDSVGKIKEVKQFHSSGFAQADPRICTYEDGSPIINNGNYYLTMSCRCTGCESKVFEYNPYTYEFKLVGVITGTYNGEKIIPIATHLMYNRNDGYWYIYGHLSNPHNLVLGKSLNDVRFGINNTIFNILGYESPTSGDEDNFVYYDSELRKWVLVYSKEANRLAKQVSDYPDRDFSLINIDYNYQSLTGINVVKIGGIKYVIAGYGWSPQEDSYKVFKLSNFEYIGDLNLNISTGGYRGWGTVIPITEGLNTKYQLITFDRINTTNVNSWQYGNLYIYETSEYNKGIEYDVIKDSLTIASNISNDYNPTELSFIRKKTERLIFSQAINTDNLVIKDNIFADNGNPYPIKYASDDVYYKVVSSDIHVLKGELSLIGGSHNINSEYLIDTSDMVVGETRYLSLGNYGGDDVVKILFEKYQNFIILVIKDKDSSQTEYVNCYNKFIITFIKNGIIVFGT